jgi:predicted nucleic acid-binding protein
MSGNKIFVDTNILLYFLKALETIIDSSEEALIQLTQEQQSSIENGRNQIKNGDFIENDKLIIELKEWLAKK